MRASDLDPSSGLLPPGIRGLSFRGVERDLFCWVWTDLQADERLVALPGQPTEARTELASTLEREHGFSTSNAAMASQSLFDLAFPEGMSESASTRRGSQQRPEYLEPGRAAVRA